MTTKVLVAALSLLLTSAAFGSTISSSYSGKDVVSWGPLDTPTYGRSFVSAGGTLEDLTFDVTIRSEFAERYQLSLYAWNPITDKTIGSALYTDPVGVILASGLTARVTDSGIDTSLIAGDSYYFGLTADDGDSAALWTGFSVGTGGGFHFGYSGPHYSYSITDTVFTSEFGPGGATPEPSSLVMLGTGAMAMFSQRRRFFGRK